MSAVFTRRTALRRAVGATAAAALGPGLLRAPLAAADAPRTTVQLLGTLAGTDARRAHGAGARTGSALAVLVDGDTLYLVDAGFGALTRLLQAGHEIKNLRHLCVTRQTIDHNADLGTAMLLAWSSGRNASGANADRRLGVTGPAGTEQHLRDLRRQQALTIDDQANALGQTPAFATYARPRDVRPPAGRSVIAYRDEVVTVRALRTLSAGAPALAYRIQTPDRDVVFTGSTGRRADLAAFARGADTIVHEVVDEQRARDAARTLGLGARATRRLIAERATPAAAARLAARALAQRLVLAGLVPGDTSDARWKRLAGNAFHGKLQVGHDLDLL